METKAELLKQAKPILFSTEMVQAILDGRKTQTRRCVKQVATGDCFNGGNHDLIRDDFEDGKYTGYVCAKCGYGVSPPHSRYPVGTSWIRPQYEIGDILYVRETWTRGYVDQSDREYDNECWFEENLHPTDGYIGGLTRYFYKADNEDIPCIKWHPSIHMPKEAARIFLRVTNVRVERLQDITCRDIAAEGIDDVVPDMDGDNLCDYCPLDDNVKGVHCYGGLPIMCKGKRCDTAFERWEEEFKSEFADLWNSTITKSALPYYGWEANPYVWVYEFERVIECT